MKFNVVLGNPPYNNDIYLDFVQLGFKLSKDYSLFITPAKWQTKGGRANDNFRKNIVPHMSKVVYYVDSKDIFDIVLSGGISYYMIESQVYDKKHVEVHNNKNVSAVDNWESSFIKLDLSEREMKLLKKITTYPLFVNSSRFKPNTSYFGVPRLGEVISNVNDLYEKWVDKTSDVILTDTEGEPIGIKKELVRNIDDVYKYKLGCSIRTFEHPQYTSYILKPNEVMGRQCCTLFIGTLDECKSANSFYGSHLVWWLVKTFFGDFSLSNNTNAFRFVPDPGPFDHIFTDQELYEKYNLTQEEINIIESVIKERKTKP